MEPALDMINRALLGDPGARSFLERTSSIYMLDVTDISQPKTYGCWNFIHQCMNEVERYELKHPPGGSNGEDGDFTSLASHVRVLATMALRVARRCPSTDKALIMTCISNYAEQYQDSQCQWLIDLNLELREIVMGRIAAMAFDFGFHTRRVQSAFADPVVMDTFCAILSANAVSSGPAAIRHFATEWIVPSSKNLPSYAVASVVLHLALEGMRKTAPAGTKEILQQLSVPIFGVVLVPILSDAVSENSSGHGTRIPEDQANYGNHLQQSYHETSSRIAAMCIRATTAWCEVTDLSLPQIKHLCSKNNIHFVSVICDAMYADSPAVVDALASMMENIVLQAQEKPVTEERMNQVRYIIQVDDESLFHSRFSPDQLKTIESKEMEAIVEDLLSSVGLQRFRFTERQHIGDHDVCRNLARIASAVCLTFVNLAADPTSQRLDRGVVQLMHKASGHPSVHISALSLFALSQAVRGGFAQACDMLPILQRRAIIPHRNVGGTLSLTLEDVWSVSFVEFFNFRNDVLAEALRICWAIDGRTYIDSCLSAVEEFCCQQPSADLSLQLEAALFCMEVVAEEVNSEQSSDERSSLFSIADQIIRCTSFLALHPVTLTSNPLTTARMCKMIRKFSRCYSDEKSLAVATALVASAFQRAAKFASHRPLQAESEEVDMTDMGEAAAALQELFAVYPQFYLKEENRKILRDVWEACSPENVNNRLVASIDVRIAIAKGVCNVLAGLPESNRMAAFHDLASRVWESLERALQAAKASNGSPNFQSNVQKLSGEIRLLSLLPRAYADAGTPDKGKMDSGCTTFPDTHSAIPEQVLATVKHGWSTLIFAANNFQQDENLYEAIFGLFSNLLPPTFDEEANRTLLRELCSTTISILKAVNAQTSLNPIFSFLENFVETFGARVEQTALDTLRGFVTGENERELGLLLEELVLDTVEAARPTLGDVWSSPRKQFKGELAFESKPSPIQRAGSMPTDSLAGVLTLLSRCLNICPVFLQHLPAGPGVDKDDDLMMRRAMDSAVASLSDADPALARCGTSFLQSVVHLLSSPNDGLRSFISEEVARISGETMNLLILGLCGKFNHDVIDSASLLLHDLLQSVPSTEIETRIVAALRQDSFILGEPTRAATLTVFSRCAQHQMNASDLTIFLEQFWELHQVEDAEALPNSDTIIRFLRRYS